MKVKINTVNKFARIDKPEKIVPIKKSRNIKFLILCVKIILVYTETARNFFAGIWHFFYSRNLNCRGKYVKTL